jgi:hypothetical protein
MIPSHPRRSILALLITLFISMNQSYTFINVHSPRNHRVQPSLRHTSSFVPPPHRPYTALNGFLGLGGGGKSEPEIPAPIQPVTLTRWIGEQVVRDESLKEMEGLILSIQVSATSAAAGILYSSLMPLYAPLPSPRWLVRQFRH